MTRDSGSGRNGGDNLLAPGEAPQSGGEAASPNPSGMTPTEPSPKAAGDNELAEAVCPAALREAIFTAERHGFDLLLGLDRVQEYATALRTPKQPDRNAVDRTPPATGEGERRPIMLEIAAADDAHRMWERRWHALGQMYPPLRPCFVDRDGGWCLRDFLDYAGQACGFAGNIMDAQALTTQEDHRK